MVEIKQRKTPENISAMFRNEVPPIPTTENK